MKILLYTNILSDGGAERVMANLANCFAGKGHTVIQVATYVTPNEYPLAANVKRLNLETAPGGGNAVTRNIRRISALRRIIRTEDPDVVIGFMREANFRVILASLGLRAKTIVSVRNTPAIAYEGCAGKLIARWLLPIADGCVFQTKDAREFFPPRLQQKSAVIPNAVRESFFSTQRLPERHRIAALGRLTQQKNYPMLIQAFSKVTETLPDAVLQIYGEGELSREIDGLISQMGLQDKVKLMGRTNDVQKVHETADLFVLSSDYEGMPNSLMEAMAAGVPVISTDCPCGGPKTLIENGKSGLLVPVGDADVMADAILRVLSDDALKAKLAAGAKEGARKFAPEIINDQWEDYLKDVAAGKNRTK